MKGTLFSIHFILHPSAFILALTPSLTVGLPPHLPPLNISPPPW